MGAELCQRHLLLWILSLISRCSYVVKDLHFGVLRIPSMLFADHVCLLASSGSDLQLALDKFTV